ncbi:MAG: hypothetical protein KA204_00205 [Chromatiaceae bacterium]|nr:hypothetical protein [Chromatiaceae bacterium]MBP8197232.1 hypothetical protein [Chromatiaceae bacterium]
MTHDKETHDRLRRIETRLTRLCLALGVDTNQALATPAERPQDGHHNVPKADAPPTYSNAARAMFKAFTRT